MQSNIVLFAYIVILHALSCCASARLYAHSVACLPVLNLTTDIRTELLDISLVLLVYEIIMASMTLFLKLKLRI